MKSYDVAMTESQKTFDQAKEAAAMIRDVGEKVKAYAEIAISQARVGDASGA